MINPEVKRHVEKYIPRYCYLCGRTLKFDSLDVYKYNPQTGEPIVARIILKCSRSLFPHITRFCPTATNSLGINEMVADNKKEIREFVTSILETK